MTCYCCNFLKCQHKDQMTSVYLHYVTGSMNFTGVHEQVYWLLTKCVIVRQLENLLMMRCFTYTCGMWMCIGPSTKFQIPEAALLDTRYNDNVADRRNGQPDTIWYSYFDIE